MSKNLIKLKEIKMKKGILQKSILKGLFLACFFNIGNLHSDILSLEDLDYFSYVKQYNSLPSVEEADEKLHTSSNFYNFFKEAEKIVVRSELEGYVGLRLIHGHFFVPENHLMSESYEVFKDVPSLLTYARIPKELEEKKSLPASWIFKNSNPEEAQVFEASSDSAVQKGIKLLREKPGFMQEMAQLITDNNFNNLLSLALIKRDSLETGIDEQVYMELNDSYEKSVVQLWDNKNIPENTIQTSWSFKGPREHRCVSVSKCMYMGPFARHQRVSTHENRR